MRLGVVQAQWFRTIDLKVVSHYSYAATTGHLSH